MCVQFLSSHLHTFIYFFFFVGLVSRYPEPQPEAWPNVAGHRAGLFPGDGPAESSRHPLQERVRAKLPREKSAAAAAGRTPATLSYLRHPVSSTAIGFLSCCTVWLFTGVCLLLAPHAVCRSNLTRGVGRFREILRAVESRTTQSLRMVSGCVEDLCIVRRW